MEHASFHIHATWFRYVTLVALNVVPLANHEQQRSLGSYWWHSILVVDIQRWYLCERNRSSSQCSKGYTLPESGLRKGSRSHSRGMVPYLLTPLTNQTCYTKTNKPQRHHKVCTPCNSPQSGRCGVRSQKQKHIMAEWLVAWSAACRQIGQQ